MAVLLPQYTVGSGRKICYACGDGFKLNDDGKCQIQCDAGQFASSLTECDSCSPIMDVTGKNSICSSLTCTSFGSSTCLQCVDPLATGDQCEECLPGYTSSTGDDGNLVCAFDCDRYDQCLSEMHDGGSGNTGSTWACCVEFTNGGDFVPNTSNCKTPIDGMTTSDGWWLSGTPTAPPAGTCDGGDDDCSGQSISHCATTSCSNNVLTCTACDDKYTWADVSTKTSCVPVNDPDSPCTVTSIDNCPSSKFVCNDDGSVTCSACNDGYAFDADSSTCKKNSCNDNCDLCDETKKCISGHCINNWTSDSSSDDGCTCPTAESGVRMTSNDDCPAPDGKTCPNWSNFDGCDSCDSSSSDAVCQTCKPGYWMQISNNDTYCQSCDATASWGATLPDYKNQCLQQSVATEKTDCADNL